MLQVATFFCSQISKNESFLPFFEPLKIHYKPLDFVQLHLLNSSLRLLKGLLVIRL